jgi:uncharacterized membrane protein YkvI
MLKEKLPVIGAIFLIALTIVNYTIKDEMITGVVGIILFFLLLILYFISKNQENKTSR